jgi:radical SAM superfamily enzyme YgiQ (UPF0313 family)
VSKVLLISANTCQVPYAVYPLGMSTVARALIDAGHDVRQFDWLVADCAASLLEQTIRVFAPDLVAVSIRNVDHVDSTAEFADTWELEQAKEVVALVRGFTSAPVIIGGSAVSVMPEQVREYVGADTAVVGEGERCIVDAVTALTRGRTLPSLLSAVEEPLCGDRQGSPCFDPTLVAFYRDKSGIIGLQSKRGCPHHCCYCTYPDLEGAKFRPRPVEAVIADLARLKRDFQVNTVFFTDSVFNDPHGHFLELAEALARRDLGVKWASYISPRGLTAEAVALCKRAGLYAAEIGTDGATDVTLKAMSKPFRWVDVQETNELFVQAGIACAHFVVFGGPEETQTTIDKGLDNIETLRHCVILGFSGLRIYRGTSLYHRAVAEGLIRETDSLFEPVYYVSPSLDKTWMERHVTEAWAGRQDRVFPPQRGQRVVAKLRAAGWKGLLWDRMIAFGPDKTLPVTQG